MCVIDSKSYSFGLMRIDAPVVNHFKRFSNKNYKIKHYVYVVNYLINEKYHKTCQRTTQWSIALETRTQKITVCVKLDYKCPKKGQISQSLTRFNTNTILRVVR